MVTLTGLSQRWGLRPRSWTRPRLVRVGPTPVRPGTLHTLANPVSPTARRAYCAGGNDCREVIACSVWPATFPVLGTDRRVDVLSGNPASR